MLSKKEKQLVKEYAKKLIGKKRLTEAPTQSTGVKFTKALVALDTSFKGRMSGEVKFLTSELKKAEFSDKVDALFETFNDRFLDSVYLGREFGDEFITVFTDGWNMPEIDLSYLISNGIKSFQVNHEGSIAFMLK